VAVTILWQQIYSFDYGILNNILHAAGIPSVPWLVDPRVAMPSIAIMATWKNVGIYIVLFLVGLQNIPRELYEAANLDGAGTFKQFRYVTLPMLNPTVVVIVVLSTIGGFSLFIEPYVLTGAGRCRAPCPECSTSTTRRFRSGIWGTPRRSDSSTRSSYSGSSSSSVA